jgi:photosystem II stability/assembly factor-like uncharacterized protein
MSVVNTAQHDNTVNDPLESLTWRCIGPFRGGRVVAVSGHPKDPLVAYFGACAGGVWKTSDGGVYWENVSDGYLRTASVGAIAVAESDPNVIYVGTGDSCIRGDVSHGDGVYKSTDGGNTWQHTGLEDTRHISRIRVDPQNHNVVFVAALGHIFGPNSQRGIFRSQDGGESWDRVLHKGDKAGIADLSMDPNNPRILFAAVWETLREPWMLTSGGLQSGLFKSDDGGDSWSELTNGLPHGLKGRIGVTVSPSMSGRVWALVEAEKGGLFRSDDTGETWELINADPTLLQRPFYFNHIFADPVDSETVYVLNLQFRKSTGGRIFKEIELPAADHHDLWIDPLNPQRMVAGNDGGATMSFNGGMTWSSNYNQPTSQFYHVAIDNQFPYRIYGTQQDNSAVSVPSRSLNHPIQWSDCYTVGSSECGHIAVRPDNPNIVYSGAPTYSWESLLRYDHRTERSQNISVWPEFNEGWGIKDQKYRFQWTYPIMVSIHDPNILYVAGNVVFRSRNEGSSWQAISPDLTRNDTSKMEASGTPVTVDTTGVEYYCTIFALAESPQKQGLFWAGSDDGLIHISKDDGTTWQNITPAGLPEWSQVNMIDPSPHDPATAYIAVTRYKLDDYRPYLYKTTDYGETWTEINEGIPKNDLTRVIREDTQRPGLLYAGTETGLYVSYNDGRFWRELSNPLRNPEKSLPVVPIHDIIVNDNDLVVATHGRSFWILDDLALVRQCDASFSNQTMHLFQPADSYLVPSPKERGRTPTAQKQTAPSYLKEHPDLDLVRRHLDAGSNPPDGIVIVYYLQSKPEKEASITILDASKNIVAKFSSKRPKTDERESVIDGPWIPTEAGINRFVWDMRHSDPTRGPGMSMPEKRLLDGLRGPMALPGDYSVMLKIGDQTHSHHLSLLKDPRSKATSTDIEDRLELLLTIRDKLSEISDALNNIKRLTHQILNWTSQSKNNASWRSIGKDGQSLIAKLALIKKELTQTNVDGKSDHLARLDAKLSGLVNTVATADGAPTKQSYDLFENLSTRVDIQLDRLNDIIRTDTQALSAKLLEHGVQVLVLGDENNRHNPVSN